MGGPTEEGNRLEGCVNDLTRVLALPAAWVGRDASRVVTVPPRYAVPDAATGVRLRTGGRSRRRTASRDRARRGVRGRRRRAADSRGGACRLLEWRGADTRWRARPTRSGTARCRSCFWGWESRARLACLSRGPDATISPRIRRCFSCGWPPTRRKWGCAQLAPGEHRRERHLVDEDRRALAALVEHSSDFIALATLEGRVFFLNRRGSAWSGSGRRAGARHPDLGLHHRG